jgi:hypothetical protein
LLHLDVTEGHKFDLASAQFFYRNSSSRRRLHPESWVGACVQGVCM